MTDYNKYYYDNSDPQEQQKREQLREYDIEELMKLDKEQLAEMLAASRADHEADLLKQQDIADDYEQKIGGMDEHIEELEAKNKALSQTLETEREQFKGSFGDLKNQVSEQLSQFKQVLTGSLRDLIKWRRENVPGAKEGDRQFLADVVQATKQPTRKRQGEYNQTQPRM